MNDRGFYHRLAESYRIRYGTDFSRVFRDDWFKRLLDGTEPGPTKTVLDAGCGSGVILSELACSFGRVLGLDLSFDMLSSVERGDAPTTGLLLGDMRAIPLPDGSVDVVICRGSLCHVDDMPAAIRELNRIVKPGGYLVVSEPSLDSTLLRLPRRFLTHRSKLFKPTHRAYSSRQFRSLFHSVELRIVRQEYFGYLAFPLCGMADLLPILPRLPFKRGIAALLVAADRTLARIPVVNRQAWHVIMAARKTMTGSHA